MKRIICDTNIWYYLGQDKDLRELTEHLLLVPTYPALFEIGTSKKIRTDVTSSRGAILSMLPFSMNMIRQNPMDYLICLDGQTQTPIQNLDALSAFLRRIASGYSLKVADYKWFEAFHELSRKPFIEIANHINQFNTRLPNKEKRRKEIAKRMTNDGAWDFLNEMVRRTTKNVFNLDRVSHSNCELFINTFNDKYKRLTLSKGSKFDANDYFDLFNLVYVGPNDLYWTEEDEWKKSIKRLKLQHYLFDDSDVLSQVESLKNRLRGQKNDFNSP